MMANTALSLFDDVKHFSELPESDPELKTFLNYNPDHNRYTAQQNYPGRNPNETDRGGWRGYDRVYSKYFKDIRDTPVNLLEIGIMRGHGLLAWQRYFKAGKVTGIDNEMDSSRILTMHQLALDFPEFKRTKQEYMDSTNPDHWLGFTPGEFDIIIDDGGHHPDTQLGTFACAWKYLKSGGLYFIEDISHRYTEAKLEKLAKMLTTIKDEGHEMEIVHHINTGLDHILNTPSERRKHNIHPDAPNNAMEYIVAIRKK